MGAPPLSLWERGRGRGIARGADGCDVSRSALLPCLQHAIPHAMEFAPNTALGRALAFVTLGGPAMWAIAALSVATMALILWKIAQLIRIGAIWGRSPDRALALWQSGDQPGALQALQGQGARTRVVRAAMQAAGLDAATAEAETMRVARAVLAEAAQGLRGLELATTIGPLMGLLGTVTGMIAAFQALQSAGTSADPATLAGGIWQALLTTAAGMGVAIPAAVALAWCDGVNDRLRHDLEDAATRVLLARPK